MSFDPSFPNSISASITGIFPYRFEIWQYPHTLPLKGKKNFPRHHSFLLCNGFDLMMQKRLG